MRSALLALVLAACASTHAPAPLPTHEDAETSVDVRIADVAAIDVALAVDLGEPSYRRRWVCTCVVADCERFTRTMQTACLYAGEHAEPIAVAKCEAVVNANGCAGRSCVCGCMEHVDEVCEW